jgi:uncharacterized protein YndB with AHSA1/START domain
MDLRPGGSFRTEISHDGAEFGPHITGCFLAVDELERIVFTDALLAGWRPAEKSFVTAVIAMKDHSDGTEYTATAMHRNVADRDQHEQLGFHDGWGTVTRQLAELVESRA